jgi:hypothetical protein
MMTQTNRFAVTFDTLAELAPEIRSARADPVRGLPNLSEVLNEFSPLPHEALFIGVANDGLPVLLNLWDPVPGPVLIVGDSGSGKTRLLQTIGRGVDQVHRPEAVKYAVLTQHPDEWAPAGHFVNCDGVLSSASSETTNYLAALSKWAHENKKEKQTVLLLIDDLKILASHEETQQYLRWLLLRGSARHVWPIVTLNTEQASILPMWLEAFRTRLYGRMENASDMGWLTGKSNYSFHDLLPGSQFALREGNNWLPFWLPNLD